MLEFLEFLSFNADIQWQIKIVQQVSKSCYEEVTLVFEMMLDLVRKKIF